jgi:hypothetical protein
VGFLRFQIQPVLKPSAKKSTLVSNVLPVVIKGKNWQGGAGLPPDI